MVAVVCKFERVRGLASDDTSCRIFRALPLCSVVFRCLLLLAEKRAIVHVPALGCSAAMTWNDRVLLLCLECHVQKEWCPFYAWTFFASAHVICYTAKALVSFFRMVTVLSPDQGCTCEKKAASQFPQGLEGSRPRRMAARWTRQKPSPNFGPE